MRGDAGAGGPLVPPQAASRATRTGAGLAPTVFPSDEAHGLGEVFGELRQLGGAVGEVFDGLELLRRGGGHGIGLGGRGLSAPRSEEHTSELQSRLHLVCRLLLEKKKNRHSHYTSGHGERS